MCPCNSGEDEFHVLKKEQILANLNLMRVSRCDKTKKKKKEKNHYFYFYLYKLFLK